MIAYLTIEANHAAQSLALGGFTANAEIEIVTAHENAIGEGCGIAFPGVGIEGQNARNRAGNDRAADGGGFFAPFFRDAGLPLGLSPAILTLWIPVGFRVTCYYFRRGYYRAYLADPPACAVGEPTIHRRYRLETAFPFILQNLHRFFLYLAIVLLVIHWVEVLGSFTADGRLRLGLGSVILLTDALLLTGYVSGCHSLRHLVGGRLDCFSCSRANRTRHSAWKRLSGLNERHMVLAWASLFSVVIADLYIRLLALGVLSDPAIRF